MQQANEHTAGLPGQIVPVRDGPDRLSMDFAGGTAEVFTDVSPDKPGDNQDSIMLLPLGDDAGVIAVADGAGGIAGGRRASRLTLAMLRQTVMEAMEHGVSLRQAMISGIEHANALVMSETRGAATTLTAMTIEGRDVRVFHIGDSLGGYHRPADCRQTANGCPFPCGFCHRRGVPY